MRDGAAVHAHDRRGGAPRPNVNGAGDHFLARARLAEDQHRRVGRGHLLDTMHDGSQPRLFADDRLGHILAIEPGEQRSLVRLERFAQPGHLVQPGVIGEGDSNRFEQSPARASRASR